MNDLCDQTELFKDNFEVGNQFADFCVDKLYQEGLPIVLHAYQRNQINIGESRAGFEFKRDRNFRRTGFLYIEIAEKRKGANTDFVPSGIYANDNAWMWVIGDMQTIFFIGKNHLVRVHQAGKCREVQIETSKGFLLPLDWARDTYAVRMVEF